VRQKKLLKLALVMLSCTIAMTGCEDKATKETEQLNVLAGLLGVEQSAPARVPSLVQMESASSFQAVGTSQQISATGIDSDYHHWDASRQLVWSSSNPDVATVDKSGVVTAVKAGKTTIRAKSKLGAQAEDSVEIEVHTAHIEHIAVTPALPVYTPEKTCRHHEEDHDKDHEDNGEARHEEHHAKRSGDDNEQHASREGEEEHHDSCEDDDDHHMNLVAPSIVAGTTLQLIASAELSNDMIQNATQFVVWSSSNPAVATVSNEPGSQGLVTGVSAGVVMIIATDPVTGKSGAIQVTVTAPILMSITLTPAAMSIPNGTTGQIVATGNYSNGTTQDLTGSAVWSSSAPTIATVATGLVTGIGVGTAQIIATDSASGQTASATVSILPAELVTITVAPTAPSIANGLTQQFTATGLYTDNTSKDLTGQVTWTSSNTAVASVSNLVGSAGLAKGLGVGVATITATLPASAVNPALISGSATLNVTPAVIVSLSVVPANIVIPVNGSTSFHATGLYTDGTVSDVTTLVTWQGTPEVAVSNAPGTQGVVTGVAPGAATVTAVDPATGVSGSVGLTVIVSYNAENLYIGVPPVTRRGTVDRTVSRYTTAYTGVQSITVSGMTADVDVIVNRTYNYSYQQCHSVCNGITLFGGCLGSWVTVCNTYLATATVTMCSLRTPALVPETCNTRGLPGTYSIYVYGTKTPYGAEYILSVQ